MTQQEFAELDIWGYVDAGMHVLDSKGNRYVVGLQNTAGFLGLENLSGGKDLAFEVIDGIDHTEFRGSGQPDARCQDRDTECSR
jgi:hypothetical protein